MVSRNFLGRTQKARTIKENDNLNFNIKNFSLNDTVKKIQRQIQRKYLIIYIYIYISDKGFVFRIYKVLLPISNNVTNNPMRNGPQNHKDTL